MKVLQINHSYKQGGSTGRIMHDLRCISTELGIESYIAYGYDYVDMSDDMTYKICTIPQLQISKLQTRLFGRHGFYNTKETKSLVKYIESVQPDIIHLHNIHNHYINSPLLFEYIKEKDVPVIWTLHDCWPFTGWCAYFDYAQCNKWITGCHKCPSLHDYPYTWFFDRSEINYHQKKFVYNGVKNLLIVTPSRWLSDLVKNSFLKEYPVHVINNGVDIAVFKPTYSGIKEKLGIGSKKMVLAVAAEFNRRKGIEYLLQLPELLSEDQYLVLVGVTQNQIELLPKRNCIGIERTNSVQELAAFYSDADVFINPTLEDNFPTTNLEALACGTPVITFRTGGSVETINEETGIVVDQGDIRGLLTAIDEILNNPKYQDSDKYIKRAELLYNKEVQFRKYIDLYRTLV